MKKNITLLRRILLNQIYMMRAMNKVIQKEDEPIANSEALYLQTFESASATAQELKEITCMNSSQRRTTPIGIKFTQLLSGIQSIGIRNVNKSLVFEIEEKDWRVLGAKGSGLSGLPLIALTHPRDLSRGDVIYTSQTLKDDFKTLSSYYLCLGEDKFVAWSPHGGINLWSSTGTYVWRVEF